MPRLTSMILRITDPNWAEALSAWSTLAAAVFAGIAGVGAIFAVKYTVKTWRLQREATEHSAKALTLQIQQLQDERDRREEEKRQLKAEQQIRAKEAREERLASARKVTIKAHELSSAVQEMNQLVRLVALADEGSGRPSFPAVYARIENASGRPIQNLLVKSSGGQPRYRWPQGAGRVEVGRDAAYLADGASLLFVWTATPMGDVPSMSLELEFDDEDGQRWVTDLHGQARHAPPSAA